MQNELPVVPGTLVLVSRCSFRQAILALSRSRTQVALDLPVCPREFKSLVMCLCSFTGTARQTHGCIGVCHPWTSGKRPNRPTTPLNPEWPYMPQVWLRTNQRTKYSPQNPAVIFWNQFRQWWQFVVHVRVAVAQGKSSGLCLSH